MQFLHPEFFYALFALLIPIFIHLFQLRRFKVQEFTNVALLQKIRLQTRKSSQLNKWLILMLRFLAIGCIIIAFSQPYLSNYSVQNKPAETVVYIDNSFSMQAVGPKGELLRRAVQDVIAGFDDAEKITVFTNDKRYNSSRIKDLKTELLALEYSPNQLDLNTLILKGKSLFSESKTSRKKLILISDFQSSNPNTRIEKDSTLQVFVVPLKPISTANSYIDTIALEPYLEANYKLTVRGQTNLDTTDSIPVTLFQDQQLVGKSILEKSKNYTTTFELSNAIEFKGKIAIDDPQLSYDNAMYFNIPKAEKIAVLAINEQSDAAFLKKLYTGEEFLFQSQRLNTLDYSQIKLQNLIILNGLSTISKALINSLDAFMKTGGVVVLIPNKKGNLKAYNTLLATQTKYELEPLKNQQKRLTKIAFNHPILNSVFEAEVTNFQYPTVEYFYPTKTAVNAVFSFEDDAPFLVQFKELFVFTAALDSPGSNFVNSPLIVPTFYKIATSSLNTPPLQYWIGAKNSFDLKVNLQKDRVLKLGHHDTQLIPLQTNFNTKVRLTTSDMPKKPGHYAVLKETDTLTHVSYNYNRNESQLRYQDLSSLKGVSIEASVDAVLKKIKIESNVSWLWKWFIIFALLLLAFEMLILKYFK